MVSEHRGENVCVCQQCVCDVMPPGPPPSQQGFEDERSSSCEERERLREGDQTAQEMRDSSTPMLYTSKPQRSPSVIYTGHGAKHGPDVTDGQPFI